LFENLPEINAVTDITPQFWENRMEQINNFEKHISQNGTKILKFYFHMSKEEQRKRLLKRLENPEDNWKFSTGDLKERERWDDYMKYYEEAINNTSKDHAPWFVIPADQKWFARVAAIQIIIETLEKMNLQYPTLSEEERAGLDDAKKQLESE
jgi:polyphosphate kinase 2 (PPK2 family)